MFLHPTTPCMLHSTVPDGNLPISPLSQYPAPMMEFLFDTARAIINLFMSGTIGRYPDITYIVPHCGGTLAPLIDRFSLFGALVPDANVDSQVTPDYVRAKIRSKQFFFDMAGIAWPHQCPMIMPYIDTSQLLYGSDFPFTSLSKVEMLAKLMDNHIGTTIPDEEDLQKVYSGNAAELLAQRGWRARGDPA